LVAAAFFIHTDIKKVRQTYCVLFSTKIRISRFYLNVLLYLGFNIYFIFIIAAFYFKLIPGVYHPERGRRRRWKVDRFTKQYLRKDESRKTILV
jgi:hypothetical protein